MKNHLFLYKILIFSLILLGFVIPPLLVSQNNQTQAFTDWSINLNQIIFCASAIIIYISSKNKLYLKETSEQTENSENKRNFFYSYFFPASYSLCLMLTISLILKLISIKILKTEVSVQFEMPQGFYQWFSCIINFCLAAVWEEIIFRYYLPEALYDFFPSVNQNNLLKIIIEFVILLLFAFGHRYSGYLAVINAGLSHIILRLCFLRTDKKIICTITIHIIFNLISLLIV